MPLAIRTLQPEQNTRNIVERFRDFCRLIFRGNSAPAASINHFTTHLFMAPVFLFQKAPPVGNTQNPTGQGTSDPSED
jgi:hypothetical protein